MSAEPQLDFPSPSPDSSTTLCNLSLGSQSRRTNNLATLFLLTDKIAQGLLNAPRSKLRDPVILTTCGWRPVAEVDINFLGEACGTDTNIEAISAIEAIMHKAPKITPTVTQITPPVPPLVRP